jgi:hypothetical protein
MRLVLFQIVLDFIPPSGELGVDTAHGVGFYSDRVSNLIPHMHNKGSNLCMPDKEIEKNQTIVVINCFASGQPTIGPAGLTFHYRSLAVLLSHNVARVDLTQMQSHRNPQSRGDMQVDTVHSPKQALPQLSLLGVILRCVRGATMKAKLQSHAHS